MKEKTKVFIIIISAMLLSSCMDKSEKISGKATFKLDAKDIDGSSEESTEIALLLDSLNTAAAKADLDKYFSYFADGATYNGTDATENWDKESFRTWAKPYFDAKTTWNFKSVQRNIYHSPKHNDIAWFDELLSTQMKICRGSGVVIKENGKWKIQQYVLSMTIPNSKLDKIVELKSIEEDSILRSYYKLGN